MLKKINENKTYYSISEVCEETGLEPHVLRYWETEFSNLKPKKNRAGNRAYRQKDIKMVKFIKHLLYDQHYTILGAKKKLSELKDYDIDTQMELPIVAQAVAAPTPVTPVQSTGPANIALIKRELKEVLWILGRK